MTPAQRQRRYRRRQRSDRDPAMARGQPRRGGPDFWPTPAWLTTALLGFVLPELPVGPIWECAAGDGRLARAIAATGRSVITTDLYPQDDSAPHDFLDDDLPVGTVGSMVVTNPPNRSWDAFLDRGLALLDRQLIKGLVLLARHDYLQADGRAEAFNRAVREVHCNWRPIWIPDTDGNPRHSFHWLAWHAGRRQPPLYLTGADVADPKTTPKRIQVRRTRGWRLPEGTVYVARPSHWGNPFRVGDRAALVAAYRAWLFDPTRTVGPSIAEIRRELRGHDLACWCPPDQPCHADVLLEVANQAT
jgi:hypothetical protein